MSNEEERRPDNGAAPRTVVVTGAGSGIGRAIAAGFAAAGDHVVIADLSEERIHGVGRELGLTDAHVTDVADDAAVSRLLERAFESTNRLDVVINSAGIFDGYAGIRDTTPELWHRVISVNLHGAYNVARTAGILMLDHGVRGSIQCVSSIGGERASLDGLSYVTSKAAVNHMVRRLAFELGRDGIRVNALCPGAVRTGIRDTSAEILGDLVDMDRGMGVSLTSDVVGFMLPEGRYGEPEEVAAVSLFLAGPGAAYINGQCINVDGGWTSG